MRTMIGATMAAPTASRASEDPVARRIAAGDYHGALAACAHQHGAALGRLCFVWLGSKAEADEASQEALLAAFDAMADYRGDGSVRAWLFGIARRVCARRSAITSRREAILRRVHDPAAAPDAPDAIASERHRAERLRGALDQLRPSDRDALVLRYHAELSFRDVALACGLDEPAARKRVGRALERLRDLLGEEP